ncbi:MAG TPA: branched-chain amino acid ABC transporter substrate-binding protein, partial [Citreicella sp.]|nr:branched-chain amino acid ABC transporter substrate-binding protein [Citreicella sp.]
MKKLFVTTALCAALPFGAFAQDKPDTLKVGMTTFLTGSASVFGVPARDAMDLMVASLNEAGGINGVPVEVIYIDEGAGAEALTSEFRRVSGEAEVMLSAISSGNCQTLAPLAEDLQVP